MSDGEFSPEVKEMVASRSFLICEVCAGGGLTEYHHRRPRGTGGSKRSDTGKAANCLGLCRDCHRMIESNRRVASILGWLVPQGFAPAGRSVIYRGVVRWLTDDGLVLTEPVEHG